MGGLGTSDQTSLERLKALDSLPDITTRIDEATKLCTHGARAEMILRWIIETLKKSTDAGSNSSLWDLLSLAVRIIPPQRVAALLGSATFPTVLLSTFAGSQFSWNAFVAIEEFLTLLLSIGDSPDGAPVKAVISVQGAQAATFCGSWLNVVIDECRVVTSEDTMHHCLASVDLALDVWALRRTQPDDDVHFAQKCLVPALGLLSIIESVSPSTRLMKRKTTPRTAKGSNHHLHSLRSLLARHCILPAREAFKAARNSAVTSSSNAPNGSANHGLRDTLDLIKVHLVESKNELLLDSIPSLLEIGILSVPTPSSRHRDREQPWLEYLFSSLIETISSSGTSNDKCNRIIAGMLEKTRHNVSLSPEILSKIVREYAVPSTGTDGASDMQLVGKVVEANSDIFLNSPLAKLLFDAVSTDATLAQADAEHSTLVVDQILLPVMTAFARGRSLPRFVSLWKEQLAHDDGRDRHESNVWVRLSPGFADLLEPTFSHAQIVDLFASVQSPITAATSLQDTDLTEQLHANLILLSAILGGIRTDELIDEIHGKLDETLKALFQIAARSSEQELRQLGVPFWISLTKAFRLWSPLWASRQRGSQDPREEAHDMVTNSAFESALAICCGTESKKGNSYQLRQIVRETEQYVATVCNAVCAFENADVTYSQCTAAVEAVTNSPSHGSIAFITYPGLLTLLSHSNRRRLFLEILSGEISSKQNDEYAFTASIMSLSASNVREDYMIVLIERLKALFQDGKPRHSHQSLMTTIMAIPAESWTKDQRHVVLDTLFEPKGALLKSWTLAEFQYFLATIWHIIEPSNLSVSSYIQPQQLWKLAESIDRKAQNALMESTENYDLYEKILRRTMDAWLSRQHDSKMHDMIKTLSGDTNQRLTNIDKDEVKARSGVTTLMRVFVEMYGNTEDGALGENPAAVDSEVTQKHLKRQIKEASRLVRQLEKSSAADERHINWTSLYDSLEAARAFSTGSSSKATECRQQLFELSFTVLNKLTLPDVGSVGRRCLVLCLKILNDVDHEMNASHIATFAKLLEQNLSAPEQDAVLSIFSEALDQHIDNGKRSIPENLFRKGNNPSVPLLLMQEAAVSKLSKEVIESTQDDVAAKLLSQTVSLVGTADTIEACRCTLRIVNLILRDKPFMVNQHGIEHTLSTLHTFTTQSPNIAAHFTAVCHCTSTILTQYRARVQDRLHLIVHLVQALLSRLFQVSGPNGVPPTTRSQIHARHATSLTRILVALCNRHRRRPEPRRARNATSKPSELVDEARKLQARTGQYVQHILHRYCALVLGAGAALGDGVREALVPGLWAVIEAIEVNGPEAIKALSAAMTNGERAVLRSVYEDWKRFGKWEGL